MLRLTYNCTVRTVLHRTLSDCAYAILDQSVGFKLSFVLDLCAKCNVGYANTGQSSQFINA